MENPLGLLVCFVLIHYVSSLQWSPQSLQDQATVYACIGRDLSLPWMVILGPGEQIVDVQWYFHGRSEEMMAILSHSTFIPLPAYSGGRVDFSANAGIVLHHVTSADAGLFSVEVNARGADGTSLFTLNRMASVVVNGDLLTSDGALHLQQSQTAAYDSFGDEFHLVLTCGNFLHSSYPPFGVEWQLPNGRKVSSTSYSDGQFRLQLDNPVDGGQYTCRVPLTSAQHSCVHHDVDSTLTLDKVDARLTLLEAENTHLKALRAQDAQDISRLQSLHAQDISHLQSLHAQDISHLQSLQTETQSQLNNHINETSRHVSFHVKDFSNHVYSNGATVFFHQSPSNNQGNAFDTSSFQFRAPYRGTYMFLVTTTPYTSTYYGNVELVVDGDRACMIHSYIAGAVASCHTIVDLSVGQLVWVRAVGSSTYLYDETAFSGFLLNSR